ncbi:hypothetical protein BACCELL_01378 [Bacteroides cellulosilyticus DSM 14838]|uniref:Uncharacterized protein n=1 Tax=Bacteroides cellulosilyticus DSM 14838 TaxID=537012 RepID=E2NAS2_9BACE|nr:hypothetical protein BACCELL_01378 [Bacteroides cellulosilyticus DSM 14838]
MPVLCYLSSDSYFLYNETFRTFVFIYNWVYALNNCNFKRIV